MLRPPCKSFISRQANICHFHHHFLCVCVCLHSQLLQTATVCTLQLQCSHKFFDNISLMTGFVSFCHYCVKNCIFCISYTCFWLLCVFVQSLCELFFFIRYFGTIVNTYFLLANIYFIVLLSFFLPSERIKGCWQTVRLINFLFV